MAIILGSQLSRSQWRFIRFYEHKVGQWFLRRNRKGQYRIARQQHSKGMDEQQQRAEGVEVDQAAEESMMRRDLLSRSDSKRHKVSKSLQRRFVRKLLVCFVLSIPLVGIVWANLRQSEALVGHLRRSSSQLAEFLHLDDTHEERKLPGSPLNALEQTDDGCGIELGRAYELAAAETGNKADPLDTIRNKTTWLPYSEQDMLTYQPIFDCMMRLQPAYDEERNSNLHQLTCQEKVSLDKMLTAIRQYTRVWFIGDSVLEQQFQFLVCAMDSTLTKPETIYDVEEDASAGDETHVTGIIRKSRGSLYHDTYTYQHPEGDNEGGGERRTTELMYHATGVWDAMAEILTGKGSFETALNEATGPEDAVIVALGSGHQHFTYYDSGRASSHRLQEAFQAVSNGFAEKSRQRHRPQFFIMEPSTEEWPTTNGAFSEVCKKVICHCETLTQSRILGKPAIPATAGHHQSPTTSEFYTVAATTHDWHIVPDRILFQTLYHHSGIEPIPNHLQDLHYWNNTSLRGCNPDCSPGRWRFDLFHRVFAGQGEASSGISIVPVWWQMVGLGQPTSKRRFGDCSLKSVDTVVMMTQQLVRQMVRVQNRNLP